MKHVSFDLETLGNTSFAPIVQIGACKFDDDGNIDRSFYKATVDIKDFDNYSAFIVDYSTIKWWLNQAKEAQNSVFNDKNAVPLKVALMEFLGWIGGKNKIKRYQYWSHATFDPPILERTLKVTGLIKIPFRNFRDIRTLQSLTKSFDIKRTGVHHDALHDAIYQAEYISKQLKFLKNGRQEEGV